MLEKTSGQSIHGVVVDSDEKLDRYLHTCAQSPGALATHLTLDLPVRARFTCQGSLIAPATECRPALVMLRLSAEHQPGGFDVLNNRIKELRRELFLWQAAAGERATLVENLEDALARLQIANAAQDEFLSLVSHELRTPITIVLGGAEHLNDRWDTIEATVRSEIIRDITSAAWRLKQLVENVLILARAEHEHTTELEPVLLGRFVSNTVDEFRRTNVGRPVTLNLPADDSIVEGSPVFLEQIVLNLLSNANKYSPAGAEITVSIATTAVAVRVEVADRGDGLSAEDAERAFEAFYRGERAQKHASGFGVGLAVCRRLASVMGAQVAARPRAGGGTVFTLELPVHPDLSPQEPA